MIAAAHADSVPQGPPLPLAALFEEHHAAVFRAAYRITGDAADAEDVLQTVFVRLLRREDDLDLSDSAASYLHRAAVNAALDLLRSRRRSRAVALADVEGGLEETEPGPERSRGARELAGRLRAALTRLSPKSAEIFALRYFEERSNLEIARLLGVSQTSIAVILHRARHRLRKELAPLHGGLS
ncbi:MAG TPA: sigma-70 family RNA polymerase sigma factor [Thermoanaerobaculia bacterium]|nr:sigma-70 family RNA polymerase sigma factor [Thermoanaerobaculia bacterium]